MSKVVLTDVSTTVNAVNLSDHVQSVVVSINFADVDLTAMGAGTTEHGVGLRSDSVELIFFQDFDVAKVDATFWPLIGVQAGFPVLLKPTTGSSSTTNPTYQVQCVLLTYQPLSGAVGTASMTSIVMPTKGAIQRYTT